MFPQQQYKLLKVQSFGPLFCLPSGFFSINVFRFPSFVFVLLNAIIFRGGDRDGGSRYGGSSGGGGGYGGGGY